MNNESSKKLSESLYYIGTIGLIENISKQDLIDFKSKGILYLSKKYAVKIDNDLFVTSFFSTGTQDGIEINRLDIELRKKDKLSLALFDENWNSVIGILHFRFNVPSIDYIKQDNDNLFAEGINGDKWEFIKKRWNTSKQYDYEMESKLSEIEKIRIQHMSSLLKTRALENIVKQDEAKKLIRERRTNEK